MNKIFKCFLGLLFITAFCANQITAQAAKDYTETGKKDFLAFYSGEWEGAGEFTSGKKIAATIDFKYDAETDVVLYRHRDLPPNSYKALAVWKIDKKRDEIIAAINDGFGATRIFVSKEWKAKKITFELINTFNDADFVKQRFIYQPLTKDSFKMTFETQKNGKDWKLGDFLVFNRKIG